MTEKRFWLCASRDFAGFGLSLPPSPGPSSPAGTKLQYKLPPGTLTSASSIKGKDSSSSTTGNTFNGAALVTPDAADAATIITEAGVLPDSGKQGVRKS